MRVGTGDDEMTAHPQQVHAAVGERTGRRSLIRFCCPGDPPGERRRHPGTRNPLTSAAVGVEPSSLPPIRHVVGGTMMGRFSLGLCQRGDIDRVVNLTQTSMSDNARPNAYSLEPSTRRPSVGQRSGCHWRGRRNSSSGLPPARLTVATSPAKVHRRGVREGRHRSARHPCELDDAVGHLPSMYHDVACEGVDRRVDWVSCGGEPVRMASMSDSSTPREPSSDEVAGHP